MRSLEEWLAHQERVHPQSIDLGLERLARVLERLDWRQPRFPSSPSRAPTARARSRPMRRPSCRPRATGSARSPRRICAIIASASASTTRKSRQPRCSCRPSSGSRRRRASRDGGHLAHLLRIQRARGVAGLRCGAARCLGARGRHGRAPGCGQRGRSDGRRGGEHRPRSSGIPRHDARGDRAREGGNFSRRTSRRCSAAATCPAVLEELARTIGAPLKRLGEEYDFSSPRGALALPRHALEPRRSARAGARGRHPVRQCGDGDRGPRGARARAPDPERGHCGRPRRGSSRGTLPIHSRRPGSNGFWTSRTIRMRRASSPPISPPCRRRGARSRCAGSSRTRMRRAWPRSSVRRSTNGGSRRPRVARRVRRGARGSHGAASREPVHLAADIDGGCSRRSRQPAPAIESSSSAPSIPSGRRWIGSRRATACRRALREYTVSPRPHEHSKTL